MSALSAVSLDGRSLASASRHDAGKVPHGSRTRSQRSLTGPLVWRGDDFQRPCTYTLQLEERDLQEVQQALENFKKLGLVKDEVGPSNFALPTLGARLETCARTLHIGHGFVVIKGLDGCKFDVEDSVVAYLGIASYIADQRGQQNKDGDVLTHITSYKQWTVPMDLRHGIHSQMALPFHNDMGCDILALQTRHGAHKEGGTYLSSAWTLLNDLLRDEPHVAKALLTPDWPVQVSRSKASHYLAPLLVLQDDKLMASMDPNRLGPHHTCAPGRGPPVLTANQRYALERVSVVARKNELRLSLESGDLLFFNNWGLLHRRDAYQDSAITSRHLVRLWLRNSSLGWTVPEGMLLPWQEAYQPKNGPAARLYALHPPAEYKVPKYSAGSAAFLIEDSDGSDDENQH
ncbi:hypothetical protein S40285_00096 [Stachybotrys chlorohalonatus IBT 40285]|uniref:TauD/TfdA-like domain-containing protein n=1 Tax=Stachybotrys chlorohalonatus (strain IBT 40285) TaxID=1283841 RepID=A0A084QYU3_STAC4|nr:hypothetical protein S40285_00096 [Stachybotrys chlorohalonata IBT 40285]